MKVVKKSFGILIALLLITFGFLPQTLAVDSMPSEMRFYQGQNHILNFNIPVDMRFSGDNLSVLKVDGDSLADHNVFSLTSPVEITPQEEGSTDVYMSVMGVPVKKVSITVDGTRRLVPGGNSIGVTLYTNGALVVGMTDILDDQNQARNPAREAGLLPGDIVDQINGVQIKDAEHIAQILSGTKNQALTLTIRRNGQKKQITVTPVIDSQDGQYRLGIWVRDSMAGVGTLTFYDPQTNMFASLGHPITDIDTKERLDLKNGEIIRSDIIDVRPGVRGTPGELKGMFDENIGKKLGIIKYNNDFGIYGDMYQPITSGFYPNGLEIGAISDVHLGGAKILTTVDNTGVQAFDCSIIKIAEQDYPTSKGMVLQITDPKLLAKTGGIVQGMSGSPIIQDNKIIGCVTHVFVNDPTKGYGLFVSWMVEQLGK